MGFKSPYIISLLGYAADSEHERWDEVG